MDGKEWGSEAKWCGSDGVGSPGCDVAKVDVKVLLMVGGGIGCLVAVTI